MKRRHFLKKALAVPAIAVVPAGVALAASKAPLPSISVSKLQSIQMVSGSDVEYHVFPDAENKMLISADGVVWMDPELKFTWSFDRSREVTILRMDANFFGAKYHDEVWASNSWKVGIGRSKEEMQRMGHMVFMRMLKQKKWYYHGPVLA